jgi:hypothetical protein
MKTIAQQLNIKSFPFIIKDDKGKQIYYEDSTGDWAKREYDSNGNQIYSKYSTGVWYKNEYDSNNNEIYSENSTGYWYKSEYDSNNNIIYFENSNGDIEDNRPKKEYSMDEIAKALNIPVNQLKIKK